MYNVDRQKFKNQLKKKISDRNNSGSREQVNPSALIDADRVCPGGSPGVTSPAGARTPLLFCYYLWVHWRHMRHLLPVESGSCAVAGKWVSMSSSASQRLRRARAHTECVSLAPVTPAEKPSPTILFCDRNYYLCVSFSVPVALRVL